MTLDEAMRYALKALRNRAAEGDLEALDALEALAASYRPRATAKSGAERQARYRERQQAQAGKGKVYFIQVGTYIKIGFSKNPWSRLEQLSTGTPVPPYMLGHMPGTIDLERALHERFAHLRVNREWFSMGLDLLSYIDENASHEPGAVDRILATMTATVATTVAATSDDHGSPSQSQFLDLGSDQISEASASLELSSEPESKDPARKRKSAVANESRRAAWEAYEGSYRKRYGVEPVRNARVNGQMAQFCSRIASDEIAATVTHYLASNNARYVAAGHSVGCLLQDAEKLRTEALTGRVAAPSRSIHASDPKLEQQMRADLAREDAERLSAARERGGAPKPLADLELVAALAEGGGKLVS